MGNGLAEWWSAAFTVEERDYIKARHWTRGMPGNARDLITLSTWFTGPADRRLAIRMLEQAADLAGDSISDLHGALGLLVPLCYAERDAQPEAFAAAVDVCERQIAIAPSAAAVFRREGAWPLSHTGFVQLAIIREKQGDNVEALRLCREAQRQGWRDGKQDWSKRIARLEKRAAKA